MNGREGASPCVCERVRACTCLHPGAEVWNQRWSALGQRQARWVLPEGAWGLVGSPAVRGVCLTCWIRRASVKAGSYELVPRAGLLTGPSGRWLEFPA